MFDDIIKKVSKPRVVKPKKNIHDRFHILIDYAITLNKEHRTNQKINKVMKLPDYALEYCTVKIDVGRNIGKTEYIKRHADNKSCIIVPRAAMKKLYVPSRRKTYGFTLYSAVEVFTLIEQGLLRGTSSFEKIYIEEPSFIWQVVKLSDFYREFTKTVNQTFIWLGI